MWFWKFNFWKKLLIVFGYFINKGDVGIVKFIMGSKEIGCFLIEMYGLKFILRIGGFKLFYSNKVRRFGSGVNRVGDEIRC